MICARNPTIKKIHFSKNSSSMPMEAGENQKKMKVGSPAFKCKFIAWKSPSQNWRSWVQKLCSTHQSTWKDAGIYEAIMSSTYAMKRHDDLILELASRWCPQTNTLVFPWGEATLTLEDMYFLGGFSASGLSALSSLEDDVELLKIKEWLELARKDIQSSRSRKAVQTKWMEKFIECGSDLEHEAFLSLWLSRFVFPVGSSGVINKHIFPLAIKLSRGVKIALGPAVLAMLYRELTALATKLSCSTQMVSQSRDNFGKLDLCALFHLVQIWAWERFPMLKPIPNCVYSGENFPRFARWSGVKILKGIDLRSALDSAEKAFVWCPYARELQSFAPCTKASELVGFDSCIEKYLPQRVARQFGPDQDIPTDQNVSDDVKQQNYSTSSQVKVENVVDCGPPPGFRPRIEVITLDDSDSNDDCSDEEDKQTIAKLLKLPVSIAGSNSNRPFPSPDALADVAMEVEDASFKEDKMEEFERADKQQTSPLTSAQMKGDDYEGCDPHGSASQVNESNEAMNYVNKSVGEKREDKGGSAGSIQDVAEGLEGKGRSTCFLEVGSSASENEFAMSCDAESYTSERPEESNFNLEARIKRLENIVYAHIKALEAARK